MTKFPLNVVKEDLTKNVTIINHNINLTFFISVYLYAKHLCLCNTIFANIGAGKACNYIEYSLKFLPRYWRLLNSKLSFTIGKPYNNQYIINDICRIYVTMDMDNAWKKIIG
jgi:hypothetical protein